MTEIDDEGRELIMPEEEEPPENPKEEEEKEIEEDDEEKDDDHTKILEEVNRVLLDRLIEKKIGSSTATIAEMVELSREIRKNIKMIEGYDVDE